MCDPLTITAIAVTTAASVATSTISAKQQAAMAKQQQESARRNELIQQETLRTRAIQEADAAALRKQELTDSAREALAVADVSAGEGGVGGNSVRSIARDIERQRLAGINAIERNEGATQDQLGLEAQGVRANLARNISNINPGTGPALAGLTGAVQGVGQGLMLGQGINELRS